MTEEFIQQILESIRIRGERPADVQYEEMIARGAIDRDGNVLLRRPDFGGQRVPGADRDGVVRSGERTVDAAEELAPEHHSDNGKARPNRPAPCPPGGRLVALDPDIAQVFATAESVNTALRALIATMPPVATR